jgi:hypothetical protein
VTFGALKELLIEAMCIGTQRLIDNATSRGHKTASMESLFLALPDAAAPLRRRLELGVVRRDCRHLSEWRHRHVAHRDAPDAHAIPLQPLNARSVGDAIEFFAGALTAISDELGLGRPYHLHQEMSDLDVHRLIERLRGGLQ